MHRIPMSPVWPADLAYRHHVGLAMTAGIPSRPGPAVGRLSTSTNTLATPLCRALTALHVGTVAPRRSRTACSVAPGIQRLSNVW
ncbi:hypothetical protein MRB53_038057 [Persea americana]|nr:hypothetical protein MRB53_038057 [Persea americana]